MCVCVCVHKYRLYVADFYVSYVVVLNLVWLIISFYGV